MDSTLDSLLGSLNNPSLPGIDLSLDRMVQLLAALGNPHERVPPVIHVAGTNGKGSTIAFLRAIYEAQGYRVHVYTSPNLVRFNERIVLAGAEIADDLLLWYLSKVQQAAKTIPVTFFEATTAAAFLAFADVPADVLLLETGLGGRLDATNVIAKPLASVMTPIGMDHMEFLGDTLEKIAAEKAGIIKPGVPCVVATQTPEAFEVIRKKAEELDAALVAQNDAIFLPPLALSGAHQQDNAALAATVALTLNTALPVNEQSIQRGVSTAQWPARLQRLTSGPLLQMWDEAIVLDGGHNEDAAHVLAAWARTQLQPVHAIIGMMQRKDAAAFLRILAPALKVIACVPIDGHTEAYHPEALALLAEQEATTHALACDSLTQAAIALSEHGSGVLLVTGSLYLAGHVLKFHA